MDHLDLRALDLDVVEQAEVDDVHPELGVLDGPQSLDDVVLRRHGDRVPAAGQYPSRRTSSRRSRAKKWIPSMNRTQLQRVHMTSECVRALSA